jgi:CheY-like chemotaxis protein
MLLKDKRIFIVEDNVQNRIVFQMAIVRQGGSVDFERHGRDAVERLNDLRQVDLIVLDLMLAGGISGFDLFMAIRKLPEMESVPIVAVSAMDASVAIPKARTLGFNGFIAKPMDVLVFPQQLSKVISGETVWYAGEKHIW